MTIWGILVAAGTGSRFGGEKQFELLNKRPIINWSFDLLNSVCDGVVVVLHPKYVDSWKFSLCTHGGATRSQSVRNGLKLVPDDASVILVHDAARPMATKQIALDVIDAINNGADGATPCIPLVDTIERIDKSTNNVIETVDRSDLVAVQTPQAFKAELFRQVHESKPDATDDTGLIKKAGGSVVVVPGDPRNIKITVSADLLIAKAMINS